MDIFVRFKCFHEMFTLEKRTASGPRTWGPSAKLTVFPVTAWCKLFPVRGRRIAVDLWVFQDLARAAERTPRPHPVTSFVLSAVLLISFRLIQFSGTLAFYHKTIFMVRCFFCRRPHLMLIEGRLKTSATQILVQKLHTHMVQKIYTGERAQ